MNTAQERPDKCITLLHRNAFNGLLPLTSIQLEVLQSIILHVFSFYFGNISYLYGKWTHGVDWDLTGLCCVALNCLQFLCTAGYMVFYSIRNLGERKRVNIQCLVERKPLVLIDASS